MSSTLCRAQGDEILPNPQGPAELRPIWLQGGSNEQQGVGDGVGGVGDINRDSLEDFAVRQDGGGLWKVYLGARDSMSTIPVQQFRSSGTLIHPVIGQFYGGGQVYFGLERDTAFPNYALFRLFLFPIRGGSIDTVPMSVVTPSSQGISDAFAADLDEDGDDELVLVQKCSECTTNYWIYKGGQGFPGDVPSHIVRDTAFSASGNVVAAAGDLDGDGHVDIIGAGEFVGGDRLEIHWGDGTLDGWQRSSRSVELGRPGYPRVGIQFLAFDCDGDGILDIVLPGRDDGYMYLFRTNGTGKSARTRPFDLPDADARFPFQGFPHDLGFVRDSTGRFASLGLRGGGLYVLTSGRYGPNDTYDASFTETPSLFFRVRPLRDCDGDGWGDIISGNFHYGGFNRGIAVVFAGGPYIPTDDSSASVRQYPLDGTLNGLSLWPNPARTTLNIAWRGDLKRMPRRFVVHDVLGREVASGTMPPGTSSARWECGDVAPGWYSLNVFGQGGALIGSAPFIVE